MGRKILITGGVGFIGSFEWAKQTSAIDKFDQAAKELQEKGLV